MPRRKAITTEDGATQAPAAVERPEGISDEVWSIAGALGNVALARALVDVTSGARPPADARETAELTAAARKLEARSYAKYTRLRDGMGARIAAAKTDNLRCVDMLADLRQLDDDPAALVSKHTQNGHDSVDVASEDPDHALDVASEDPDHALYRV